MKKRSVNVELPEEVWKIIEAHVKPKEETDSEILCKIIKNHLAEHIDDPDLYLLKYGHEIKDDIDLQNDMIISLEILERKRICTFQEWAQIMNERIMTEE